MKNLKDIQVGNANDEVIHLGQIVKKLMFLVVLKTS